MISRFRPTACDIVVFVTLVSLVLILPRLQAVTENTHESITAPLPLIVSTFTTMLVSPSLAKASAGARAKLIFHRSLPEPKCMRPLLALV